ncbi:MAG: hypothetical protein VKJ02_14010 [Snowella sp.]|nr:hypothetical protein [Snowella sp.]
MPYSIHHFLSRGGRALLPLTLAFSMTLPSQAQTDRTAILLAQSQPNAQSRPAPQTNPPVIDPAELSPEQIDPDDPNDFRPLSQSESLLSLAAGQRLMNEAIQAINAERYDIAIDKLQQARKIFNQLSNFHLQLANSFSGIDPKVFEAERTEALKTGQVRDDATYKLALVHRAKNQPELAVPLLIQVIRSQNPTTDLGRKSYQQLYELGFVDIPFNPPGSGTSGTPTPPKP